MTWALAGIGTALVVVATIGWLAWKYGMIWIPVGLGIALVVVGFGVLAWKFIRFMLTDKGGYGGS